MIRIVACLLVLVTAGTAHAAAAASRAAECEDVAAYFERVDEAIVDGMGELIEQPGFRENFGAADRKTKADGPGFLALSIAERQSLLAYLGMPGEVLGAMDEEEIPGVVRDLHESATRYWILMADMLEAVSDGAPTDAMPYFDRLDAASGDNVAAQQALSEACPDEVGTYAGQSDDLHASFDVFGEDLITVWEDADAHELAGIGYGFLFFASEDDIEDATPEP